MLRLLVRMEHSLSWVIGCVLWSGKGGACICVVCFAACCPMTLGASLREVHLVALWAMAVVSGPPNCVGCFVVRELCQTVEALLSMFSFVWHLPGGWPSGWRGFALFLATVSESLSLLESQVVVLAMVVS